MTEPARDFGQRLDGFPESTLVIIFFGLGAFVVAFVALMACVLAGVFR